MVPWLNLWELWILGNNIRQKGVSGRKLIIYIKLEQLSVIYIHGQMIRYIYNDMIWYKDIDRIR